MNPNNLADPKTKRQELSIFNLKSSEQKVQQIKGFQEIQNLMTPLFVDHAFTHLIGYRSSFTLFRITLTNVFVCSIWRFNLKVFILAKIPIHKCRWCRKQIQILLVTLSTFMQIVITCLPCAHEDPLQILCCFLELHYYIR